LIISRRKLASLFSLITQQNVTHLILPDVRFDPGKSDLEGEMLRKQQQQQQQKKASKKTNK